MDNKKIIIVCPKCKEDIRLDDVLTEEIKKPFIDELSKKDKEIERINNSIGKQVDEKLKSERSEMERGIILKLEGKYKEKIQSKDEEINKLQDKELELREEKEQLEKDKRSLKLTVQREVDKKSEEIRKQAVDEYRDEHHWKDAEKDKKISDMATTIDDLKRKVTQGSQQAQGEVMELEIADLLKSKFPLDEIIEIAKGVNGADILQKVHNKNGQLCGSILWESKNTKAWSNSWIQKLKDDQRDKKAEIGVLVSDILPEDIKSFKFENGICITRFNLLISLAILFRANLIQLAITKLSSVNKNEKMEILFHYLTGSQFRQRVEGIIETFKTMGEELEEEKRASTRRWAKREKSIERIMLNTSGMYGDLQGLIGNSMQTIPLLEEGKDVEMKEEKENKKDEK